MILWAVNRVVVFYLYWAVNRVVVFYLYWAVNRVVVFYCTRYLLYSCTRGTASQQADQEIYSSY